MKGFARLASQTGSGTEVLRSGIYLSIYLIIYSGVRNLLRLIVQDSTAVILLKFCAKNPRHRQGSTLMMTVTHNTITNGAIRISQTQTDAR